MARAPNAVWAAGVGRLLAGAAGTWLLAAQPQPGGASEREPKVARLDYVELPVEDMAATRTFYERAFGWSMTQFAPTYAATTTNDTDIGLASDPAERPEAPIAIVQVEDLEAALGRAGRRHHRASDLPLSRRAALRIQGPERKSGRRLAACSRVEQSNLDY